MKARKAVKLQTELSATAIVQMMEPQTATDVQRSMTRARARAQVKGCTRCELHRFNPAGCHPVPLAAPKRPAFVVVGEAPGPEEIKKGTPFIGKSGKLLRALMKDVGIDPVDDVLWCNTVSCFPNREGEIRAPTEQEQSWCRDNLMTQIEAGYTRYVLLVGAKAFNAFRTDLTITNHHGKVFIWTELYCVMGIIHPAAALRKRAYKQTIRDDLERWGEVVWSGENPLTYLGETCIRCGEDFVMWDRDGVPYCSRHLAQYGRHWEKDRIRWNEKIEQLSF